MIFDEDELASAVLFLADDGKIIREMLYSEFEAILDGYVPATDMANREFHAVYLEIDSEFNIHAAVFFLILFTNTGEIDHDWSLPLEQLARHAAKGPNLGAGPIRLACASHCPIKHHKSGLWDPHLRSGKGEFSILQKSIKKNGLSLQFRLPEGESEAKRSTVSQPDVRALEQEITQRLRREYSKEFRDHMAQLLKEQRLRATTVAGEHAQFIDELKRQHNGRIEDYKLMLSDKGKRWEEERQRNTSLKETIDGQAEKIAGLREYFELKLEQAQGSEAEQIKTLRENYEAEAAAKMEAATTELKELLQMREVELLYRNEQEAKMHDELSRLRDENKALVANSGDQLLSKMVEKGLSFVTYQPGAGHITVPISKVSDFMASPVVYVAEHCGVSEDHYNAWLEHYHAPICSATNADGSFCGENINRIEAPIDFHSGETDCCHKHRGNGVPNLKVAGS